MFLRPPDQNRALSLSLLVSRLIVGAVLLYAGFTKAVGPAAEFAAMIEAYKILPPALAMQAALLMPYLEMGLGMFLIAGFETRRSALAAGAFFVVFILAISSTFLRGIDLVSCGCFGAGDLSPKITLFLDCGLFLLCLLIYRFSQIPARLSLDYHLKP